MTNGICAPCPGRKKTNSATDGLLGLVVVCMLVYIIGGVYYLSRPALSKDINKKVNLALSRTESFRGGKEPSLSIHIIFTFKLTVFYIHTSVLCIGLDSDNNLDRESFSKIMSSQDGELHLTPRESMLVFENVDTDKSGKVSPSQTQFQVQEQEVVSNIPSQVRLYLQCSSSSANHMREVISVTTSTSQ